jgi:hypothetical protein
MTKFFPKLTGFRLGLVGLLLVSLGLRLVLVMRGGQGFWADESRYFAALGAWQAWAEGQKMDAVRLLIGTADHLGFKVLMLGPSWVQLHVNVDNRVPSSIISLFSVANIFWVWRIARHMGGDEREAFWSAAAMACANSMFYWARHLMPYDVALFWALACAAVALRPTPRLWHSFLAGFLGFVAFVTYNGYWATVACVLTAHVLLAWPRWWLGIARALLGAIGLGGSFLLLLMGARYLGIYLIPSYLGFAGTINQGDFNDGYVVFFDYLWRVEGFTALIWLGALLAFGWLVCSCPAEARRRGLTWVATIVALAAILIIGSNVLGKFVVYGRLARQVAPFCALLVGWTAARLFGPGGRSWRGEGVAFLVLLAGGAWSMATPLRMEFPIPFHLRALEARDAYVRQHVAENPAAVLPQKFRILYDGFIWAYPAEKPLPPHYLVLLSSPHPLAWRPYLYEGFNRDQRDKMEATDITMRLVLLQD